MGRQPCCDKVGLKRGPWTIEEDRKLTSFILTNGIHCWRVVPKLAGLLRCGKSCRLRWINYLRPDLKRGGFTESEEDQIIELHSRLGNRWSKIASHLPGRTDNEIKNHWNTRIKKRLKQLGVDPATHKPIDDHHRAEEEADTSSSHVIKADHQRVLDDPSSGKNTGDDESSETEAETVLVDHVRNDHPSNEGYQGQDGGDEDILKDYEVLYGELDMGPACNTCSASHSSSLSSVEEYMIDPSLWDSIQEEEDSLRRWVDGVDSVLSRNLLNQLDVDLFFLEDGFHDMQQFSVPEFF